MAVAFDLIPWRVTGFEPLLCKDCDKAHCLSMGGNETLAFRRNL
jgi:hypothetical protein